MVEITIGRTAGVDMRKFDFSTLFDSGTHDIRQSSLFAVNYGDGNVDKFIGHNFTYNQQGEPNGGIVNQYTAVRDHVTVMTIDGLELSAAKLAEAAETPGLKDNRALIKSVLSGDDTFSGGKLSDRALTYGGNDELTGNGGADRLYGGGGADTFIFNKLSDSKGRHVDVIGDFSRNANDRVDLSAIDANGSKTGNGTFDFIGNDSYSGTAGELRTFEARGKTFIAGNVNGDMKDDFRIALLGSIHLTQSDFDL